MGVGGKKGQMGAGRAREAVSNGQLENGSI